MKIPLRGTPDEINTVAEIFRSSPNVASVSVSEVYKRDPSHKTGIAWAYITFVELIPSQASIQIKPRRGKKSKGKQRTTTGFVYLLRTEQGHYKIGKTVNPQSRKKTFGVRLPFAVEYVVTIKTDDYTRLEKLLHQRFAEKRMRGSEFFALTSDDVQFILSLGPECSVKRFSELVNQEAKE